MQRTIRTTEGEAPVEEEDAEDIFNQGIEEEDMVGLLLIIIILDQPGGSVK